MSEGRKGTGNPVTLARMNAKSSGFASTSVAFPIQGKPKPVRLHPVTVGEIRDLLAHLCDLRRKPVFPDQVISTPLRITLDFIGKLASISEMQGSPIV